MRLIFMGTPDFSVSALHALLAAGHDVVAVYTQPPRPAGRGKALRRSPVHEAAEAAGIEVRTPSRVRRDTAEHAAFAALNADAAVVAAYGLILPKEMLDAPRLGCLNIHASLLPRWRGASPIQSAILAGDSQSGVSIMQMDEGLDTGAVLLEEATPISATDTASTLHDRLSEIGGRLVVRALAEHPTPVPQPSEGVTYAERLTREDGRIDWRRSATEIDRQIRGLTPWPGAFTTLDGVVLKIGTATPLPGTAAAISPGTTIDDALTIACGTGAIRIERVQKPGRSMISAADFLRGQPVPKGTLLV
ncbi:methionyl-tRNA formyltransferase [Gluconobacter kanchanaburiensis]|uniref:Methionyl-tRNA formyltransferase n=1 Tax=Gluconobacter kanchanaburiensis NBRC 103587 TaxID=1307948 RepID=A0A511B5P4_9PROT|nr:methionyl-tRNA formyltransferase [Gluconobacter kanchanaburiensis]MBF0860779.1 methionyl-tRNA formyltransferase [Gluconobacter kanchanaburiensis]GBR69779.1 methionyl-tRNA formyl transferase [Gluconobacter kanchanaburiensis NBRC 103587]GEK95043.1 methionyl-tRNA formyltransferase [Gluconobacter kanchanaburiensis NBRC 103587]